MVPSRARPGGLHEIVGAAFEQIETPTEAMRVHRLAVGEQEVECAEIGPRSQLARDLKHERVEFGGSGFAGETERIHLREHVGEEQLAIGVPADRAHAIGRDAATHVIEIFDRAVVREDPVVRLERVCVLERSDAHGALANVRHEDFPAGTDGHVVEARIRAVHTLLKGPPGAAVGLTRRLVDRDTPPIPMLP